MKELRFKPAGYCNYCETPQPVIILDPKDGVAIGACRDCLGIAIRALEDHLREEERQRS